MPIAFMSLADDLGASEFTNQFQEQTQMSKQSSMVHVAVSSVLALAGVALGSTALAADDGKEQCAGIAKAGKNDCATSTNACHGHVTSDGNAEAWIYVPAGTCDRIVGGRVVHVKAPPPSK
jgi:uncharacterized membrane protein